VEIDLWPLDHEDGDCFSLTNRTGAEAINVEVRALRAMLDHNGEGYVRRVPSVATGESFQIRLNRVGFVVQPELEISWVDCNTERAKWSHRLGRYI